MKMRGLALGAAAMRDGEGGEGGGGACSAEVVGGRGHVRKLGGELRRSEVESLMRASM
jgi:hypothetical protein